MDKLERVARAICRAKGKDPDVDSGNGRLIAVTKRTSSFSTVSSQEREPQSNWTLFMDEARVFVAAHDALYRVNNEDI